MVARYVQTVHLIVQGKRQISNQPAFIAVGTGQDLRFFRVEKVFKVFDNGVFDDYAFVIKVKRDVKCVVISKEAEKGYEDKMKIPMAHPQGKRPNEILFTLSNSSLFRRLLFVFIIYQVLANSAVYFLPCGN
jgi:hypothetical protein